MKWLKMWFLVILMLLINIVSYPQAMLKTSELNEDNSKIKIVDKIYKSKNDYLDINVVIPQINGISNKEKEEIVEEKSSYKEESGRKGRRDRKRGRNAEAGMVRLFINVGKNQRVQAKDIVGAIAGEAGIPGKLVGTIDIYDKYTFVEVPKENAKKVLDKMKNIKIKGNKINIEKANTRRK